MPKQKTNNLPEEYRPLSPWAYFGYHILYNIPIVGWIFAIIFALDNSNINRRNFTRSFFIVYLVIAILFLAMFLSGVTLAFVKAATGN